MPCSSLLARKDEPTQLDTFNDYYYTHHFAIFIIREDLANKFPNITRLTIAIGKNKSRITLLNNVIWPWVNRHPVGVIIDAPFHCSQYELKMGITILGNLLMMFRQRHRKHIHMMSLCDTLSLVNHYNVFQFFFILSIFPRPGHTTNTAGRYLPLIIIIVDGH